MTEDSLLAVCSGRFLLEGAVNEDCNANLSRRKDIEQQIRPPQEWRIYVLQETAMLNESNYCFMKIFWKRNLTHLLKEGEDCPQEQK
jgi:hypothetical protein